MNTVILTGRLCADPELKHTASTGNAMARFTLAVDRNLSKEKKAEAEQKKQPTADFIGCVCWGKTAELIGRYFNKGSQIAVQGRIQTGSYEANDGTRRYTTDVVVDRFDFIGSNQGKPNNSSADDFGMGDDGFEVTDDDIPF